MAVIRVNKNGDYTVMANVHLRERALSLQAKGLLSLMLSLPDDWDYSVEGLVAFSSNGKDSCMSALRELERHGYVSKTRAKDSRGRFVGWDYDIYETPKTEKPNTENPNTENPNTENPNTENPNTEKPPQQNTKELNTKELNTLLYSFNHSIARACACDDENVNEDGGGGDPPSLGRSEEELKEEPRYKGRELLGGIGRGVVMLSEEQIDALLDKLTLDEFRHYVGVVANCVLSGKIYTKKTHFQAILDMAMADRRTKQNAR